MTSVPQVRAETAQDRLARARRTLGEAERRASRWGGRIDRTALRSVGEPDDPGSEHGPEAMDAERAPRGDGMLNGSAAPGADEARGGPTGLVPAPPAPLRRSSSARPSREERAVETAGERRPVPAPLEPLIPHGSLRAGSSVAVAGSAGTSLLLALATAAAGDDAWCAIAGLPDLGLRAVLDAGLDPCRLAIVPDAAEQTAQVLSALVDGVGIVVLGPRLGLTPALWRSLTGRARTRDALILAADPPGRADLHLTATARSWDGLGTGSGRLRRRRADVTAQGRGIAGSQEAQVLLPEVRGMIGALSDGARTAVGAAERSGIAPPAALQVVRRAG